MRSMKNGLVNTLTKKQNKRKIIPRIQMKFVDDLTLAEEVNVKECVIQNPDPNPPRPLAYHDRTLHVLPSDTYTGGIT